MSSKRRRERDRPKAGPDAAYDPNKRVLLSYGDSDEEAELATPELALDPRAYAATKADGTDPGALLSNGAAVNSATGGTKDSHQNSTNAPPVLDDDDEYNPEEAVPEPLEQEGDQSAPEKSNAHPGRNRATNQKPALGTLSYQWDEADEEEGYGTAEDEATAYLRAVRQERQSMPSVFRAVDSDPDANLYEEGDSRGYYDEDCYIARPLYGPQTQAKTTIGPREAYTNALKARFTQLHHRLRRPPEPSESADATSAPFVPKPQAGKSAYAQCLRFLRQAPPHPTQLQLMSTDSVFATLELIDKHFLQRNQTMDRNASAWIFALLARLDEVGNMVNDNVSALRELGKRAVIVQISFKHAMTAAQLEGIGDCDTAQDEAPEASDQADAATEPPELQNNHDTADSAGVTKTGSPADADKENTLATLDMILAIVGEIFGQRDLLEFRRSWELDG